LQGDLTQRERIEPYDTSTHRNGKPAQQEDAWLPRVQLGAHHVEKNCRPNRHTIQTWLFGDDLAMVFLPGEVVVDYELRLKREFDPARLWVNAYSNDAPCYIPSRRIWEEGGYEGASAMTYYDRPTRLAADTEDRIFAALGRLLPKSFAPRRVNLSNTGVPTCRQPGGVARRVETPGFSGDRRLRAEVVDPVAIDSRRRQPLAGNA
jgi:hypothetical protein